MKQNLAVRRVMTALRGDQRLRSLITKRSEDVLRHQAVMHPGLTRAFLKNLLRMQALALPITKLVIPKNLAKLQNKGVFNQLGNRGFLFQLIDENGVLDLRKAGLRTKHHGRNYSPGFEPLSMEDYQVILDEHSSEFIKDEELANLFLFKAILRARIDLYKAGERRSAQKAKGEDVGITPELQRVKDFLDFLATNFPFDTVGKQNIKDGIEIASRLISDNNHPAANTTLASRTPALERILQQQTKDRVRRSRRARGWKVSHRGRGIWQIYQSGHRKTKTGLLRRKVVKFQVPTAKLLSMIQHEIDSINKEIQRNKEIIAELTRIQELLPECWDELLELYLEFTSYLSLTKKEKVLPELEGALELATIPSDSEQPLRLAKDLLELAKMDVESRQKELHAQRSRFEQLEIATEEKIGRELEKMANQICKAFANPQILLQKNHLLRLDQRLGGMLGTFFNDEMREPWLGQAKSRVVGVKKALPKIGGLLDQKLELVEQIRQERERYKTEGTKIWRSQMTYEQKQIQFAELDSRSFRIVSSHLRRIDDLNRQLVDRLVKAGRFILLMRWNFQNRHGKQIGRRTFFRKNRALWLSIQDLNSDRVEVLSKDNRVVLGRIARQDAEAMGFKNIREISGPEFFV